MPVVRHQLPDQKTLQELLEYDPDSGKLFWKPRSIDWFNPSATRSAEHIRAIWNVRYAGKEALATVQGGGYASGPMLGKTRKKHRVIWKLVYGYDPIDIDHIDGDRLNNRLSNLRNVTRQENTKNRAVRRTHSTGVTGVCIRPSGSFVATIWDGHKNRYLGDFKTLDDAATARKHAQQQHGFHPNHGRAA